MNIRPNRSAVPQLTGFWIGLAIAATLLPWWRNHAWLRDLYDYGLFINANARLAEGQTPFVGFSTPIQTLTLLLNYAAECGFGGTYVGMTYGAAGLILAAVLALGTILMQRWPAWLAWLTAGALVLGSASQHTIIFYNPLGVLTLALVTWSFALAPLLRRETAGWHLVAAAGLFLGGLNKLNFHAIACAIALGWVLRAGLKEKGSGSRMAGTVFFLVMLGVVLPIATEMFWTGAGPHRWYRHVIELPLLARGGRISLLGNVSLYLTTLHDYYGRIRIPQIGLIGVLLPVPVLFLAWRREARWAAIVGPLIVALAALATALASVALLLTNNEIAYVTFAAAIVLVVGLWLGFELDPKGWIYATGLLVPIVILAVFGGESAWNGQRSQFGHSQTLRDSYANGATLGSEFGYIAGLNLPPELVGTVRAVASRRTELSPERRARLYYGPGLEWLERIWPVNHASDMALVSTAFDGPKEKRVFQKEVIEGGFYKDVLVMEAWDHWLPEVEAELAHRYSKEKVGSGGYLYQRLPEGVMTGQPLTFVPGIGGNVDGTRLTSTMPRVSLADGTMFLGLKEGAGSVRVLAASHRASGTATLKRSGTLTTRPLAAHFAVFAVNGTVRYPRWQADLSLPEGQAELLVPTGTIDASGLPLDFEVAIPMELSGQLVAGWNGPTLLDTVDSDSRPPILQPGSYPLHAAPVDFQRAMLPEALSGRLLLLRNSWTKSDACFLPAGGEAWVKLEGLYSKITLTAALADGSPLPEGDSALRVVFYKGGRLAFFHPVLAAGKARAKFSVWSPERDGWLGILVDTQPGTPSYTVRVVSAERP